MVLDIFNEEGVEQYDFKELAVQYDIRASDGMLYKYITGCPCGFGVSEVEWNDYSTLDSLYLLKQLREYAGGDILLSMGGLNERKYKNSEVLVKSLEEFLCDNIKARVIIEAYDFNNDDCVQVGYDDLCILDEYNNEALCYILPISLFNDGNSPRIICKTNETFLSDGWINDIANMIANDKWHNQLLLGQNIKGTSIKSRLPYLGYRASCWINQLPKRWSQTDKFCFLADFLKCHGELNFKGDIFLGDYGNMTRKEKADMVKSWLDSYDRYRNKYASH